MEQIKTIDELNEFLKENQISAQERYNKKDYTFLIYYFDNKSNIAIYKDVSPSIETSIRGLPKISKQATIPVQDIDIVLRGVVDETNQEFKFLNKDLDYHIYFKDEEKTSSVENTN